MSSETISQPLPRTAPTIWVKEITLFKSIKPIDEIRSIPFTLGLNIIQGEWNDSADTFESGHGNGKTTLCRLIRYCLGEKTFGQQHVVEEVKHCFPTGYVGAVVHVGGEEWAVLRPLGHRGKDIAKIGVKISELIGADDAAPYRQFEERLDEVCLSTLDRREVFSGGNPVQWMHLLALCSRDQESRYDRFWNLRHLRSDSGTPRFTKGDVSLCVRSILGLLDTTEPGLRKQIADLESQLKKLDEAIKNKMAEPTYHITRLRTAFTQEMGVANADIASLEDGLLFGVEQASTERIEELQKQLYEINSKITPLDRQINIAAAQLNELLELQEQRFAASEATHDGNNVMLDELSRLRNVKQGLLDRAYRECIPGRILFGDCEKVKAHLVDVDEWISEEQKKTLPQVVSREQAATRLIEQAKRQNDPLNRLREILDNLNSQKNALLERRRTVNDLLKRIPIAISEIVKWHRVVSGEIQNDELAILKTELSSKSESLASLKSNLTDLLAQQSVRANQFGSKFNDIVQRTINKSFRGTVVVEDDGMFFRINRERSLGGEAYETLAVLLADIAILVESSIPTVSHPGILIHDSPREADLNVRLYERMLDVAFSFMEDENGKQPYQYIVTTTTHPSPQLQSPSITKVTLRSGSGSLFKKQLDVDAPGAKQKTLFDMEEEA